MMGLTGGSERFHCFACGDVHDGTVFRDGAALFGRVVCPKLGERVFPLSTDAELFASFRRFPSSRSVVRRCQFALLHVTERCSMRCPVCFVDAGAGAHRACGDVIREARDLLAKGVRKITLTGGEPTEHPEILRLARELAGMGASVSVLTNGRRLGEEREFAAQLKAAGVRKVHISFDTLVPEVSVRLRGGDYVALKKRALAAASEAGLAVAANVMVSELNIGEVGDLFRFLVTSVPRLSQVLFQPQRAAGRGELSGRVDRERVVNALTRSPMFPLRDPRDFIPLPRVPAFGIDVHPDCGALSAVFVRGTGDRAVLRSLDAGGRGWRLFRRLAAVGGRPGFTATVRALCAWLSHAGPNGLGLLRRWWRGSAGPHVVLAIVDNLPDADFVLEDRIRRCGAGVVCLNGELAPLCAGYCTGRKGAV